MEETNDEIIENTRIAIREFLISNPNIDSLAFHAGFGYGIQIWNQMHKYGTINNYRVDGTLYSGGE